MRVVLDTNILVSALITKGGPSDQIYQAWADSAFELLTSDAQIDEVTRVLSRPKLRRYVGEDEATQMIAEIRRRAIVLGPIPVTKRSPDPKDDPILAIAVEGGAELLVSGDKRDVLELGTVEGIPMLSAREALKRIGA